MAAERSGAGGDQGHGSSIQEIEGHSSHNISDIRREIDLWAEDVEKVLITDGGVRHTEELSETLRELRLAVQSKKGNAAAVTLCGRRALHEVHRAVTFSSEKETKTTWILLFETLDMLMERQPVEDDTDEVADAVDLSLISLPDV